MDQPTPAAPGARPDLRVHARSLAFLYAIGATLVVVTVGFHQPAHQDSLALLGLAGLAYVAAAVLRFGYPWLPARAYPTFVFLGTLLVTCAIERSGEGATAYATFYIWVAVYSFYFFTRRQAYLQLAAVAAAYGAVLAYGPPSTAPAARWVLTVGTLAVAGSLVGRLVDAVRERAAEAAGRAERLHRAEQRLRTVLETADEAFVSIDSDGHVIAFNPSAERMSGWRREEILGRRLSTTVVPPRQRAAFDRELARFVETGTSPLVGRHVEFTALHRDGHEYPVEVTMAPMRDGEAWILNAFAHDITDRKRADREIREHAEDLRRVAEVARDLAGVTDAHAARPAICTAARDLGGARVSILYEPDPRGRELVSTAVAGAQVDQIHLPFTGPPSGAATAFTSGRAHFVPDLPANDQVSQDVRRRLGVVSALWQPVLRSGVPIGVLTLAWSERVEEVSERVRSLMGLLAAEAAVAIDRADLLARLEAVARTDDLTGLANRRAWDEHLPRELSRARRDASPLCVAMLDIDRFKEYNDERGHQAGDRLLKQVAATWREMLRPSDLLARYGGEEFGLVLPNCTLEKGMEVVERLRACTPAGQTCSAGLAVWDGDESPDLLVSRADGALYDAKNAGRDRAMAAI
jgi:diguanylate cyclase (GGDEF)-like protein/PAS domain S-box-containing protein